MAIGSAPEIGLTFGTLEGWDSKAWRKAVGNNLLGGYAELHYPPNGDGYRHWIGNPEVSLP